MRQLGKLIDGIVNSKEFDSFSDNLMTVIKGAEDAAFKASLAVVKFVASNLATVLRKNKNDQVGAIYQSFNRFEHYPHGERKRDKVPDLSGNMFVDYSIFATAY